MKRDIDSHKLCRLRLTAFRLRGGRIIRIPVAPGQGISAVCRDFVSIRVEDLLYLAPYTMLAMVRGKQGRRPHVRRQAWFQAEIRTWIDPYSTMWHFFINKRGRRIHGAIEAVDESGVHLRREKGSRIYLLAWPEISAGVELLE